MHGRLKIAFCREKGYIKCVLKVPLAYLGSTVELSANVLQNLFHNLMPQTVAGTSQSYSLHKDIVAKQNFKRVMMSRPNKVASEGV